MHRKLTITVDENVYQSLHETIERGDISQIIEELIRANINVCDREHLCW